jgi:hypothetical protein
LHGLTLDLEHDASPDRIAVGLLANELQAEACTTRWVLILKEAHLRAAAIAHPKIEIAVAIPVGEAGGSTIIGEIEPGDSRHIDKVSRPIVVNDMTFVARERLATTHGVL